MEFLKGLAGVIDKFSGKILHKRIIPNLTNLLKFNHLVASIIFITIDIMKKSMISVEDWRRTVWPELKSITQGKEMTAQSLYLLVSNMEVLEKFTTEESFMSSIIPLYLKCFDCPPKLKLLALRHV
jgi:SCY1-like protein 2